MNESYTTGLVSVIIPTYRRAERLTRAVDSVLKQTYSNFEVLLINDNEPGDPFTEELQQRTEPFQHDPRFQLIIQERHTNGAAARNVGIRRARGEYIAFLDDDDWWEPGKLEEQVRELESLSPEWGGVSCKYTLYDRNNKVLGRTKKYRDGYIYKDILNLLSDVATGTLLLRHEALDEAGYFDETLSRHQDLQLLVFFTSKYKLKQLDRYLHCVDVSDAQNRPDPEKLIKAKKAFFKSVAPVMETLSKSDRKCIYAMHRYELGYIYLKNGNKKKGLRCCLAVLGSPKALVAAFKKTVGKLRQIGAR